MDKQCISIEPEIIQFGPDSRQLIKIINKTNQQIDNCFFCLFNVNKFEFSPDSFALQPKEHKLVTVTLKLKVSDNMGKQFAYLKSKTFNKRLTLITSRQQGSTSDKMRSVQEGIDQINTLSSRDYKQTQKSAYEKIISQKEAYILKLERKLQQNSFYGEQEKQEALTITNKKYLDEIDALHLQLAILAREKEQALLDNIQIHAKFKEYKTMMETDTRLAEIESQAEQIKYLELQCQQFLRKIEEKQAQIQESQYLYASKIDGIIKEGEKKLQSMEQKIQQERRNTENILKSQTVHQTQRLQQKLSSIEAELSKKQKQIELLQKKLGQEESRTKELSAETVRIVKAEQEKEMLAQQNKEMKEKLQKLENSYATLKEETIIFKSKLEDQDESSEKMHQYLQVALQSCKNENEILKKSKADTEKLLIEEGKARKYYETKVQELEQSIKDMLLQVKGVQEQLMKVNNQRMVQKQQNHDKLMQLRSDNVGLLEKINANRKKQAEKDEQVQNLREAMRKQQRQLQQTKDLYSKLLNDYKGCFEEKERMERKIEKYRKEAKKSIKSISDNAKDELRKLEEEKNMLSKKVEDLQISAMNAETKDLYNPQARLKTRTLHEEGNKLAKTQDKQKFPMSVEGDHRRVGIRNQRRQLEESQVNSQSGLDMDKIYSELGQLREFRNYTNNEIKKMKSLIGMDQLKGCDQNMNMNGNSIFTAINFFKELEHKLANQFGCRQKLVQAQKQIEFLRGRLSELEPIAKTLKSRERKQEETSISLKQEFDRSAVEYIREQMKTQYKKHYDALKLSEEKYQILRKKIYEEYRARIIELLSKKDRDQFTLNKIEAVLERFVEGLGNTSHKEALLAKQVKLKQEARKQASVLKDKLTTLTKQMQASSNKKGNTCIREPVRVLDIESDREWLDVVRMEARLLTLQAENARHAADKELNLSRLNDMSEELKRCEADLQSRQQQIQKLKKEIIEISRQYEIQKQKQEEELNCLGKKFEKMQKMEKQISDLTIKQKENTHLKEELQEKREMIKNFREREKMLQQLLDESRKNESTLKDRDRKQYMEQSRMQESLRDLKDNNRELRAENSKLREQIDALVEQNNKKNATLKRLKSQTEDFRIKNVKNDTESIEKLRSEVRELKQELKRNKEQGDKQKRKKEREITEKLSEIERLKSESSIEKSSLESIIRALTDTIKSIYCSLDIMARKKGKIMAEDPKFDALIANPGEIKTTKIRQCFDEIIETLKN